jgi:hypothetical protein
MWVESGGGEGMCVLFCEGRWRVCMWRGRPEHPVNTSDSVDEKSK